MGRGKVRLVLDMDAIDDIVETLQKAAAAGTLKFGPAIYEEDGDLPSYVVTIDDERVVVGDGVCCFFWNTPKETDTYRIDGENFYFGAGFDNKLAEISQQLDGKYLSGFKLCFHDPDLYGIESKCYLTITPHYWTGTGPEELPKGAPTFVEVDAMRDDDDDDDDKMNMTTSFADRCV